MKKIINGRLYDTETAKLIGSWSNGLSYSDFNYCIESLFQKKTGEYFLYGRGGAMTIYSKSCDNNTWCAGDGIIPIAQNEAKEWAETHLTADEYIELFGVEE